MDFRRFLKENNVILDGATGTVLQSLGLKAGELPERWNITHQGDMVALHKAYYDAGSNVVSANTFGANLLHFNEKELEEIISSAIFNVKKARELSSGGQQKFVAADIGPTGKLLEPFGDLKFEKAVEIFSVTAKLMATCGAEIIFIQTMNDCYETKAAVLAVKESCDLPIIVCNAYGERGKLMTGATPSAMSCMLEGLGVDAVGANCSYGPEALGGVIDELLECSSLPVVFMPNAGMPKSVGGKTVFDVSAEDFALSLSKSVDRGVRVVGGCCGTTPEYIKLLARAVKGKPVKEITEKNLTRISSYSHEVVIGDKPIIIGERINPTGKKLFKKALIDGDYGYALKEGAAQAERGADVLDVNVGIPDIDEKSVLVETVLRLQAAVDTPLQIDTSNYSAMESAMRLYNGKPLVNSVNGKEESMEKVFPLIKKYGGTAIALTLDENGIPETPEGRLKIAEKIIAAAKKYGVSKKDIVFDPLVLTVGADKNAAKVTLGAVELIKEKTGCKISLGISNVSYGLPNREALNAEFLSLALAAGLDAAIANPFSEKITEALRSFNALSGYDNDFGEYLSFCKESEVEPKTEEKSDLTLKEAVIKGFKDEAAKITEKLLEEKGALDIINGELIPALDEVGKGYEEKRVYLPNLLMSAEAAKSAFNKIKENASGSKTSLKCDFVIATVRGDIHDIGKNIVKLLLENYGFKVTD
ncbi:MAG: homocysteine S-methyltransferase family protein, partial [Clostridia bacterium]|nr:homocysteine S-methyltransferase family protein [Clostridia bacterium]